MPTEFLFITTQSGMLNIVKNVITLIYSYSAQKPKTKGRAEEGTRRWNCYQRHWPSCAFQGTLSGGHNHLRHV